MKLWIAFHHHAGEELDDWEVYLEGENVPDCESWAAIGSTWEFRAMHLVGVRSEAMPGYKDKFLLKDNLTSAEVATVRNVASEKPLDNEADFWDGRIYCLEIINQLERDGVLNRGDGQYCDTRQLLRVKWRTDDGTTNWDSDDMEVWYRGGDSSGTEDNDDNDNDNKHDVQDKVGEKVEETVMTNGIYRDGHRIMRN